MDESPEREFLGRGWAFPVRPDETGEIMQVDDEEDVRESVALILATGHGERVMRPDFGAGLQSLVFEPISTTTMALVRHRVEEALVTWEPRINVEGVRVSADGTAPNRLTIEIDYRVRPTNTFYNLVYPFYLEEGEAR